MSVAETFYDVIRRQGITRRSFTKFCSLTAASLGLGADAAPQASPQALETKPRVPVIWMHGLECTCCSESFIRSAHPLAKDVMLSMISLDYDDTHHGRGRPSGRSDPRGDPRKIQRPVHSRGRRQSAAQRRRHVLHRRRQALRREAQGDGRRRHGHHRLGRLRLLGLRAGRQAESDPGHADRQGHHRQADHQGAGLPADRRSHDRRRDLHHHLRPPARTRPPGPAEDVLLASASTTNAIAARISTPASSSRNGTTRARARAIASTRWAARGRPPTTPARRCAGTTACPSRSSPATAASAVPKTVSGTRGRSTSASPTSTSSASRPMPTRSAWPPRRRGVGVAAHAAVTAVSRVAVKHDHKTQANAERRSRRPESRLRKRNHDASRPRTASISTIPASASSSIRSPGSKAICASK